MATQKSLCDPPEFEQAFRAHAQTLRNFLFYKGASSAEAEDLMQEAFIRLWKNCAKVPAEKARAFLFKVGGNLFLNEKAHEKVILKFEREQVSSKSAPSPEFEMEEKEFMDQLEEAISNLSEGQREVFLLNRIEKMTYAEIAALLGVSQKAIEKRMHKALLKLRDALGDHSF